MPVERLDQSTTTDLFQVALHRARYDLALQETNGASGILEIGTGCGELSERLSRLPCKYMGVEIDPAAAAQARGRIDNKAAIIEADARRLPFGDREFSHVVCLEVLEHLGDYKPAIDEIRRCLDHRGKAIISVPYRKRGGKNPDNPYHLYEPGERELTEAFEGAFSKVQVIYQFYEESWWMRLARQLHLRRLVGLDVYYRRLVEGHPEELARLRLGEVPRGMITNLILIAENPKPRTS